MKTVVFSLGGSLIIPGDNIDINYLKKFRQFILSLIKKHWRVVMVTGGGRLNTKYNKAAQAVTKIKPVDLDWIGIRACRLNSELIRAIFSDYAYEAVVINPNKKIKTKKPIIIGTGWVPGCSSDKDAVLLAKNLKAQQVINLTDIDCVYDKDPDLYKNAKPLYRITWLLYKKMFGTKWTPRLSVPFDPIATRLACRSKIEVVILNGRKLDNIRNYLSNKKFKGTLIK